MSLGIEATAVRHSMKFQDRLLNYTQCDVIICQPPTPPHGSRPAPCTLSQSIHLRRKLRRTPERKGKVFSVLLFWFGQYPTGCRSTLTHARTVTTYARDYVREKISNALGIL